MRIEAFHICFEKIASDNESRLSRDARNVRHDFLFPASEAYRIYLSSSIEQAIQFAKPDPLISFFQLHGIFLSPFQFSSSYYLIYFVSTDK